MPLCHVGVNVSKHQLAIGGWFMANLDMLPVGSVVSDKDGRTAFQLHKYVWIYTGGELRGSCFMKSERSPITVLYQNEIERSSK